MKSPLLALVCFVLAAPMAARAGMRLVPAGSLIQCTVSEPKLNSQTTAVGDPVLCRVGYTSRYSGLVLPYQSYLVGRFQQFKDPGHFVGKGWMELLFDHMVIEPDTLVPLNAKVVGVPGYEVDREGRILGKGHPVRDTVKWMIPVLWPIDLLTLPRRGPRPTLRSETRLTLKVMDDFAIPTPELLPQDPSGLLRRTPSAYTAPGAAPRPQLQPVANPLHRSVRPEYVRPQSGMGYSMTPPRPVYVSPHAQAWTAPRVIAIRNEP